MSLSEAPTLTVDDYVKTLRSAKTVTVTVKNIRKGQIKDEGDYWSLPIMMEKSISYVNSCGTFFDSQEYFKNNYKLIATLNIDKYSGRWYNICSITFNSSGTNLNIFGFRSFFFLKFSNDFFYS